MRSPGAAAALVIAAALLITQQVLPQNLLRQQIVAQIQRSTGFFGADQWARSASLFPAAADHHPIPSRGRSIRGHRP
ncbi:MAG: hypothetical protein WDN29_13125 [Methylovirgula sp.]